MRVIRYFSMIWLLAGMTLAPAESAAQQSQPRQGSVQSQPRQVSWEPTIPRPKSPARLSISELVFWDSNGNSVINAEEVCRFRCTLTNRGKGTAYAIRIEPRELGGSDQIRFIAASPIWQLASGESVEVALTFSATKQVATGQLRFVIEATDANGFSAKSPVIQVNAKAFDPPQVVVADYIFSSRRGGIPSTGETISLQILVQNRGYSGARRVKLDLGIPKNVFLGHETTSFDLGDLEPGETQRIEVPVFTNNRFTEPQLSIQARLSEKEGKYAENRELSVDMSRQLSPTHTIEVASNQIFAETAQIELASLRADVDINIPSNTVSKPNVFALIVGNEVYSDVQQINVPFAQNDAVVFKEYVNKTLGVPSANIQLLVNASRAMMASEIERLCNLAKTYTGPEPAELIFYYAGHGMPDAERNSYLIPVDIPGTQVQRGIALDRIYRKLSEAPAAKVTLFIDACFSGGGRDGTLLAARGISVEPNRSLVPGNIVAFTASSGNQSALPYADKHHGIFTYYLLKKMQESQGDVSYETLADYLRSEVSHNSYKINNAEQTPHTFVGLDAENEWSHWRLR